MCPLCPSCMHHNYRGCIHLCIVPGSLSDERLHCRAQWSESGPLHHRDQWHQYSGPHTQRLGAPPHNHCRRCESKLLCLLVLSDTCILGCAVLLCLVICLTWLAFSSFLLISLQNLYMSSTLFTQYAIVIDR